MITQQEWKSNQRDANTARCCSKAEPKILPCRSHLRRKESTLAVVRRRQKFRHTTDPFQGAQVGENSISWRWSLPLPTIPVWWRSIHAISSYRGNRPTNTHTHPQTHKQDRLQYTVPLSLACSVTRSIPRLQTSTKATFNTFNLRSAASLHISGRQQRVFITAN